MSLTLRIDAFLVLTIEDSTVGNTLITFPNPIIHPLQT